MYRFHYNAEYACELRDIINEKMNVTFERETELERTNIKYFAWDRICAIMDRLQDTISYVNSLELGNCCENRAAFDFYDYINCSYVIIDCIKTMGLIFKIDIQKIKDIEKSTEVFGDEYGIGGCDQRFFEYIRSLCSVHPLCTNHQKEYLNENIFHCCPFVRWVEKSTPDVESDELVAYIYKSTRRDNITKLSLHVKAFDRYLEKWIDFIVEVIESIKEYTNAVYDKFRGENLKDLSDFQGDILKYIFYLKEEYQKRFDGMRDHVFDSYARAFMIHLTDSRNEIKLNKYKEAIRYALTFLHNSMQTMSFEGYENTGIQYQQPSCETDLFEELGYITTYQGILSKYSYNFQKVYYLSGDSYSIYDRMYARNLLEEPKDLINQYVYFTNQESDEEVELLVKVALYLDALTHPCFLNKNIPNEEKYREHILDDIELERLYALEEDIGDTQEILDSIAELVERYGY